MLNLVRSTTLGLMRALLIDADTDAASPIRHALGSEGIQCEATGEIDDAMQLVELFDFDVVLLPARVANADRYLPLRRLRAARVDTPIVVVLEVPSLNETLKSLEHGADDCVASSKDARELVARIRAVVRRSRGLADSVVSVGRLSINLSARTVEADGAPIGLTMMEYQLLELLALRRGKVVTKETISDHLYGGMRGPDSKTIDVFLCRLRKKLASVCDGQQYVHSERGRGYVLRSAPTMPPYRRLPMAMSAGHEALAH